jgi:polar amino acid transport system permease protein
MPMNLGEIDTGSTGAFILSIIPPLLRGLLMTLQMTFAGFALALVLGLIFAVFKTSKINLLRWLTTGVVEFIRNTPLLIQLFFLYFVLPNYGVLLPTFLTGAVALGLHYATYTSEVYRAGLEAVPRGQREAAVALNLSPLRAFFNIILPQAVPRIIPALGNYFISMTKDVAILSTITVLELLTVAQTIGDRTFRYLIPLSMVGLIYLLLTLAASTLVAWLDRRLPKGGIELR